MPKELSSWKIYNMRLHNLCPFNVTTEELLREHNFNNEDSKTVRVEPEKYFDSIEKEIWN